MGNQVTPGIPPLQENTDPLKIVTTSPKKCLKKQQKPEKDKDVKIVPECVEDVTVAWCNEVLHKGDCIPADVFVNHVEAQRLTNDSSDMSDGGGLSGSLMIKVVMDYR